MNSRAPEAVTPCVTTPQDAPAVLAKQAKHHRHPCERCTCAFTCADIHCGTETRRGAYYYCSPECLSNAAMAKGFATMYGKSGPCRGCTACSGVYAWHCLGCGALYPTNPDHSQDDCPSCGEKVHPVRDETELAQIVEAFAKTPCLPADVLACVRTIPRLAHWEWSAEEINNKCSLVASGGRIAEGKPFTFRTHVFARASWKAILRDLVELAQGKKRASGEGAKVECP